MARAENNAWDDFRQIIASGQLWRYFYEPERQLDGIDGEGFAANYLQNNIKALSYFLEQREPLSLEQLCEVHKLCLTGIDEGVYFDRRDDPMFQEKAASCPGVMMQRFDCAEFQFLLPTISHQQQLKKLRADGGNDCDATLSKRGYAQLMASERRRTGCSYRLEFSFSGKAFAAEAVSEEFGGDTEAELNACFDELCDMYNDPEANQVPKMVLSAQGGEIMMQGLQLAIDAYYAEINAADKRIDADEKRQAILLAIATVARECALHHPFFDGNGRVFQMLLPIKLCLDNNITPPLMNINASLFAGHRPDEMLGHMQTGMMTAKKIAQLQRESKPIASALPCYLPADVVPASTETQDAVDKCQQALLAVIRMREVITDASFSAADEKVEEVAVATTAKPFRLAGIIQPAKSSGAIGGAGEVRKYEASGDTKAQASTSPRPR